MEQTIAELSRTLELFFSGFLGVLVVGIVGALVGSNALVIAAALSRNSWLKKIAHGWAKRLSGWLWPLRMGGRGESKHGRRGHA